MLIHKEKYQIELVGTPCNRLCFLALENNEELLVI